MDFANVDAGEFNERYDTGHVPERQRIPGFLTQQRWIGAENSKLSVATYDLDSMVSTRTRDPGRRWTSPYRRSYRPARIRELPMKRIAAAFVVIAAGAAAHAAVITPGQVANDILPPILPSGIAVALAPFVVVPDQGAPQYVQPIRDGSGRIAINDVNGRLYVTTPAATSLGTPYLDLTTAVTGFDGNFMGAAFAPDFATSGRFYTVYQAAAGTGITPIGSSTPGFDDIIIKEWTAANPNATTFTGTSREAMRISMPSQGHTVGTIAFNPNATAPANPDYGMLYIGMGDTGDSGSLLLNGQNLSNPYGKVLRIDPTASGGASFTIPAGNPFAGQPGKEGAIWAYGFRNPQQFSWEIGGQQRMFIADIGEAHVEEVNIGIAGGNYGWSTREGTFATFNDLALGLPLSLNDYKLNGAREPGLLFPAAQYDHREGNAIGGGLLYQGKKIPALVGKYIVSDIVNGRLLVVDATNLVSTDDPSLVEGFSELDLLHNGTRESLLNILGTSRADARLGEDENGDLFLSTKHGGTIFQLGLVTDVPEPEVPPSAIALLAGLLWLSTKSRAAFRPNRARSCC